MQYHRNLILVVIQSYIGTNMRTRKSMISLVRKTPEIWVRQPLHWKQRDPAWATDRNTIVESVSIPALASSNSDYWETEQNQSQHVRGLPSLTKKARARKAAICQACDSVAPSFDQGRPSWRPQRATSGDFSATYTCTTGGARWRRRGTSIAWW